MIRNMIVTTLFLIVVVGLTLGAVALSDAIQVQQQRHATSCDCGTICEKGFHCGLKDCPHGRN